MKILGHGPYRLALPPARAASFLPSRPALRCLLLPSPSTPCLALPPSSLAVNPLPCVASCFPRHQPPASPRLAINPLLACLVLLALPHHRPPAPLYLFFLPIDRRRSPFSSSLSSLLPSRQREIDLNLLLLESSFSLSTDADLPSPLRFLPISLPNEEKSTSTSFSFSLNPFQFQP